MRLQDAWNSLEKENRNLKLFALILCSLSLFLTVAVLCTATKDPLIIERSCYSKAVPTATNQTPTEAETKAFIEKALSARFNTTADNLELLSEKEKGFRSKEQLELSKQKMIQKIIVNEIRLTKDLIVVDADRLITVQNLRTVLHLPLRISLESTNRSEGNPYGLLLADVSPQEEAKTE